MNRIKLLREEKNMSQKELSIALGVSEGSISLYENEGRKPSYEILLKLSEIFECSIDYIVGKTDKKNIDSNDFDSDKIRIGLSSKDYTEITDIQKKQIEDFARFVLKDNEKKNKKGDN